MKVNMDQKLDEKPVIKKSKIKPKKEEVTEQANKEDKVAWQEQLKGIFRQNKFWIILLVILSVVFLSVNSNANNAKVGLTVKLNDLTSKLDTLQAAIDEVKTDLEEQAKIDAVTLTKEEEVLAYNNAIEQGIQVRDLQNVYKNVNSYDNDTAAQFNANKTALNAYFDEDAQKAQGPWYGYNDKIPGTWEFVSKASFSGNTTKVLWLCYADEDHTLLAYCTGVYNADTKLFSKVEWKVTKYVMSRIGTDEQSEETGEISPIVDSLQSGIEDGTLETNDTGEPFDENTTDTNNEITNTRDDVKQDIKNGEIEGETLDPGYLPGLGNSSNEAEGDNNNESINE